MINKLRFERNLHCSWKWHNNQQTNNVFQDTIHYLIINVLGGEFWKNNNCQKTYFLSKMHLTYLAHLHRLTGVPVHFFKNCSSAPMSSITKSNCSHNSLSSTPRTRKHTKQRHSHFKVWLIWHHISLSKIEKYRSSKKIHFSWGWGFYSWT